MPLNEYDVHFSLTGYYGAVEAKTKEEAIEIVQGWIEAKISLIESEMNTAVGAEFDNFEAIDVT